jgi:hypothetical protein
MSSPAATKVYRSESSGSVVATEVDKVVSQKTDLIA